MECGYWYPVNGKRRDARPDPPRPGAVWRAHGGSAPVTGPLGVLAVLVMLAAPALAQSPRIYAPDGTYLGNLNTNQFDPNSVSNPFGRYGNPYSPDSINNPYGKYGSPFSPNSVRNPFATGGSGHR
jgi:hypothetical protein